MTHSPCPGVSEPARSSREQHTFRGNLQSTRHGWLRLTPAYSVRLVESLLASGRVSAPVLDPFCGTGTTLLSCTEHGFDADTTDINPFLIWLARAKVQAYAPEHVEHARAVMDSMCRAALQERRRDTWLPPMFQIEKWWSRASLAALGGANEVLTKLGGAGDAPAPNLLRLAFCQALIESSRAHFGHQSMSLSHAPVDGSGQTEREERESVVESLRRAMKRLTGAAARALPDTGRQVLQLDARRLHEGLPEAHYGSVVTSPPYANRMSYIRELRPYMYWLRYLEDRKSAGVLDWRAIGGTWGAATSNLGSWAPDPTSAVPEPELAERLAAIAERSPLLSNYVRKYFDDMQIHLDSLARVLRPGARAFFVVGNSKFYDVVVPVEAVLARQFERARFSSVEIEVLRKRSSKKELYEYLVSAQKR
jgi:tRNA G10  N-methylase Trm11